MQKMMFAAALGVACAAQAQVVLDGVADKSYGAAIAVQNTQTQFGDSNLAQIDYANGSEIDAVYAKIESGVLFLVVAGNLESNFNKLEVFIDGVKGGQNQVRGNNPDVDFNGLNRMGDDPNTAKVVEGLTFDAGFAPDLWVSATCGGSPFAFYMNYSEMLTKGGGFGTYLGTGGAGAAGAAEFTQTAGTFGLGIDNSNAAGVPGGVELGDGTGVRSGVEMKIPLAAIQGYAGGDLKICVFINGGGHDFVSNQVIGGIGGGPNLAEPRALNFANIPGDQFFTVSATSGPACPADFDSNGSVDAADLASLLGSWGGPGGDLDGNGTTDAADLAALLGAWGACS